MDKMYSLDEVSLLPSWKPTLINSRSIVNPFDENGKLPVFVSPMPCIIDNTNFEIFSQSKVIPILPRSISSCKVDENAWIACSLNDFIKMSEYDLNGKKILIDIANGHMKSIYDIVAKAKDKWPNCTIMIGNIAHPLIYLDCCKAGVDYVRVGIGGGNGCSTSSQTGIHASLPWLLTKIKEIKGTQEFEKIGHTTKIIADGGIDRVAKAMKCIGLGADYVMMGKTFAQCEEACSRIVTLDGIRYHEYYGMASERGQLDLYGKIIKNPEGIVTTVPITTDLTTYCNLFESVLRSAMSYAGALNLDEFKTQTRYEIQSLNEFKSYDK